MLLMAAELEVRGWLGAPFFDTSLRRAAASVRVDHTKRAANISVDKLCPCLGLLYAVNSAQSGSPADA